MFNWFKKSNEANKVYRYAKMRIKFSFEKNSTPIKGTMHIIVKYDTDKLKNEDCDIITKVIKNYISEQKNLLDSDEILISYDKITFHIDFPIKKNNYIYISLIKNETDERYLSNHTE
jgi:hypothetical protein